MKANFGSGMLLIVIFSLFYAEGRSQAPGWQWAHTIGGINNISPVNTVASVLDDTGNVYVLGSFEGVVDFDHGPGSVTLSTVYSKGFVAKYNGSGDFIWVSNLGASRVSAIDVTDAGDIYVSGGYSGPTDFDPDTMATYMMTAVGTEDAFVCRLNNSGGLIWARSVGGLGLDWAKTVAADDAGNVYVNGNFTATADLDPDTAIVLNFTAVPAHDDFIIKVDSSGKLVWAKIWATQNNSIDNRHMMVDDDFYIYTTGHFYGNVGPIDFDPNSGVYNVTGGNSHSVFVCKMDSAGNLIWAKAFAGSSAGEGRFVAIDPAGSVHVTGYYQGVTDFDPDTISIYNVTATGLFEAFVCKLDSNGKFSWVQSMGGSLNDIGEAITTDASGNVFTTGTFKGTADFDPDSVNTFNLVSSGSEDIFISKLNSSGAFEWVKQAGSNLTDRYSSVATGPGGGVFVTGTFEGNTLQLDSLSFPNICPAGSIYGFNDFFIARTGDAPTSLNEQLNQLNYTLFPNPASGSFTIFVTSKTNDFTFTLIDLAGKIIRQETVNRTNELTISINDLAEGIYVVKLEGEKFTESKRLVVIR